MIQLILKSLYLLHVLFQKEENKVLTKEEKQAEAERLKKIQEEADLKLAKEAFGNYTQPPPTAPTHPHPPSTPKPTFSYVRVCDLDVPREKWLNFLQTVETLIRCHISVASNLGLHCLPITLLWVSRLKWVNKSGIRYIFSSFLHEIICQ